LKEEPYNVQLQILNSAVKTFLKTQTEESYNILNQIFEFTSKEADNPDLRERGFVYWRLMAIDPNIAAQIVLCEKPRISEDVSGFDSNLLDVILNNLGTLSSIYAKPPELFVKKTKKVNLGEEEETDYEENAININENEVESINQNIKRRESSKVQEEEQQVKTEKQSSGGNLLDLNDILAGGSGSVNPPNQQQKPTNMSIDMMNIFESNPNVGSMIDNFNSMSVNVKKPAVIPKQVVLNENTPGYTNKSTGLFIEASLQREMSGLNLIMIFYNKTPYPIQDFEIQFNKNYFGLSANSNQLRGMVLQPGSSETRNIEISVTSPDHMKVPSYDPPVLLQTAIRCTLDEYYFTVPIMFSTLFQPQNMKCSFEDYQGLWASVQAPKDLFLTINNLNPKYQYEGVR
jgi:AP-1 complex subunit beta-1